MAAKFIKSRSFNSTTAPGLASGRTFIGSYFKCGYQDIEILNINTSAPASNWSRYGTNASFFNGKTANMSAFHIWSGVKVRNGGDTNLANAGDLSTRMDCMYCLYIPSSGSYAMDMASRVSTVPKGATGDVTRWALGGFDLMVSGSYANSGALMTAINNKFNTAPNPTTKIISDGWLPGYDNSTQRTAIGYKGTELIFGGFFGSDGITSGPTVFEMHKIMKALGCSKALLIDGGGSTQIKYKEASGTNGSKNGDNRKVYCQIALTTTAANSCVWNATS